MTDKYAVAFANLAITIKRANMAFERGDIDLGADYIRDAQAFIDGFEHKAYPPAIPTGWTDEWSAADYEGVR